MGAALQTFGRRKIPAFSSLWMWEEVLSDIIGQFIFDFYCHFTATIKLRLLIDQRLDILQLLEIEDGGIFLLHI